jgi:nucleotide-binding universal stress UspA family protein
LSGDWRDEYLKHLHSDERQRCHRPHPEKRRSEFPGVSENRKSVHQDPPADERYSNETSGEKYRSPAVVCRFEEWRESRHNRPVARLGEKLAARVFLCRENVTIRMPETILVAVDGSPLSKRAFEQALSDADSTVVALHVIDPTDPGYSAPIDVDVSLEPLHGSAEWYEKADEIADGIFEELTALADGSGVDVETETLRGDPARAIVEYARDNDVDAIYVGGHGRTGETNLLLGSVAELVATRASVSVTVVR